MTTITAEHLGQTATDEHLSRFADILESLTAITRQGDAWGQLVAVHCGAESLVDRVISGDFGEWAGDE